ncbi:UDP-N-acetylmuramoyl-tripeptide--D-alanyl-D-alanine ligase [Alkalibaculum sp. M08DMB]|uniref:UDP-N-acetylmuramoyl-tripeptide--D-alanyl-D-alanine ligase n=1 Tax=Alkalibaculum sporogenes TaxID=2655001 RepID=A0A6A7K7J1_9FIRM|nr:UDP-N-acetylmuramoyl-tripeptide--D-alanyl-D-alanine ligase [Alkalibaculum sporogenes]MPW25177.1 UDP-N-acetylmuramoyl-tripeptide--D-alanyl-D-alanine ligase [Alkalibaculum sporogenes]
MIPIEINIVVEVTKGKLFNSKYANINKYNKITSVCIDSRLAKKGSLFIALKGKNIDGHDCIEDAIKRGAVAILIEKEVNIYTDRTIIQVKDNIKAIHELTKYYRSMLDIPILALTGSSGKTTTKDIIYSVLQQKFNVHRTKGNQNNELGVPLTMFQIEKETEIAVIEMGMNHQGEISKLVHMAVPDISIITNVGVSHMEHLGTKENIFKAKREILETLKDYQIALVNGDDEYLSTISDEKFKVVNFGIQNSESDIYATDIDSGTEGLKFRVHYKGNSEYFSFKFPGIHNVYNCITAIFLGKYYGLTFKQIQDGLQNYNPSNNRMDIRLVNNYTVINDSYNANPDSMKAALNVLTDYKSKDGRAIAVIGDMLEMGIESVKYHLEVGEFLALKDIDYLVSVGQYAKYYISGAKNKGMESTVLTHFENNKMAADYLRSLLKADDVILIKGSRGMSMEEILHLLERS